MSSSLRESDFISLGYIPRSVIAGSYDSSIFNFLEDTMLGLAVKPVDQKAEWRNEKRE